MSISHITSQLLLLNLGGIYSHLEAFPTIILLLDLPEEALWGSSFLSLLRLVTQSSTVPPLKVIAKDCYLDLDDTSFLPPLVPVLPSAIS